MGKFDTSNKLTRRDFLKFGGGLIVSAATASSISKFFDQSPMPAQAPGLEQISKPTPDIHLAISDGWIQLPGKPQIRNTFGDLTGAFSNQFPAATDFEPGSPESGLTIYNFGFRDMTGMPERVAPGQKMKAQASAPLVWINQEEDYLLALSYPGLQNQPDLAEDHTIYWRGFHNSFPISNSEPRPSLTVPIGRTLTLHYKPNGPGTYLYGCWMEATERLLMSSSGAVFVRPIQNGDTSLYPSGLFAYNDQDGSTGYDREFAITLTDVRTYPLQSDRQIQSQTRFGIKSGCLLVNGRVYPDTLVGNGGEDIGSPWGRDDITGDLLPPPNRPDLRYQPISALIEAVAGERILIRFANLSFQQQIVATPGLKMKVVGRNATLLRGRDGTDLTYPTDTVAIGGGESLDVIISAPAIKNQTRFLLYNRQQNSRVAGYGDLLTEIRIHPPGTLTHQTKPNTNPHL